MELEEVEDEEWDTRKYSSKNNAESGCMLRWVLKRGVCVGKKILVAGFLASAAPVVVPPLVVASAIGIAFSMPYAVFLASHVCTQNLMSKLLPRPNLQDPPLREEMCFQLESDDMQTYKDEQALVDKTKRHIEMDGFQFMKNGENMTLGSECGPQGEDATDGIEEHSPGEKNRVQVQPISGDNEEFKSSFGVTALVFEESQDQAMEGDIEEAELRRETKGLLEKIRDEGRTDMSQERGEYVEGICGGADGSGQKICPVEDMDEADLQRMSECGPQGEDATDEIEEHAPGEKNGVQMQPISGDNEEFKSSFGVTAVVLEESQDQAMEGDIEEAELQRETKGLLEKIRDEGRTDMTQERGEYVEGICGGGKESDQKIGPVVDEAWEDKPSTIGGTEEDLRKEEDLNVCEEMLHSRTDESKDTMFEGKEFDTTNDSKKPLAEPSELLIPAEPIEDLPIEALVYNIPMDEDSPEVISEKIDMHQGKLDYNISDFENQESQMHELNERMYLEDADAREIANESALDLFYEKRIDPDENAYTIDLHEESLNIDGHTDSMEVLISSVEQDSGPSECSFGENVICPSEEAVLDDENMWEQINVIRKIVGYEGTKEASCADELKALYIFTGVEPPTSLDENSIDPLEIKEKLLFLMSIVGIKSNMT